jgi:ketosteroid isomerase-like protein
MSQETVEIVRAGFDQWSRSGFSLDGVPVERYAPDVEWDLSAYPLVDFPDRGRGRDELLRHFAEYFSGWREYSAEVKELTDAGEHVVVVLHEAARIGDSGVLIERDVFQVFGVRGGQIISWQVFETETEALAAVGLSE